MKKTFFYLLFMFSVNSFSQPGALDQAFGTNGVTVFNYGAHTKDESKVVVVQTDGKILVGGTSNADFAVVRLNADGSADGGFGIQGKTTTDFNAKLDVIVDMVTQEDGKILVLGNSQTYPNSDIALARYNSNGTPDTTFSSDGKLLEVENPLQDYAHFLSIQGNGKILVVSTREDSLNKHSLCLRRYMTDGSVDVGFGNNGRLSYASGPFTMGKPSRILPDGRILVCGGYNDGTPYSKGVFVTRFNTDGSIDQTFGVSGVAKLPIAYVTGLASVEIQSDNKIVIGMNRYQNEYDFLVCRFLAHGAPDSSFGTNGVTVLNPGGFQDVLMSIKLQNDGKILAAGWSTTSSGNGFTLVRFKTNGLPDSSFNNNGVVLSDFGYEIEGGTVLQIQNDNKIVVAGIVYKEYQPNSSYDSYFTVARYLNDVVATVTESGCCNSNEILLYPNPCSVNAYVSSRSDCELSIYDSFNRKIKCCIKIEEKENKIPVEGLLSGIYFFEFKSESKREIRKVVVY